MIRFVSAVLIASFLLTSCGDDEGFTRSPIPSGRLTVINAIPDSPDLTVVTNNLSGGTIGFGQATPSTNVLPQIPLEFRVSFRNIFTNVDQTVVEENITLEIDFAHTILLTGTFDAPVSTTIIDPPFEFATDTTDTRIRFINASSSVASATANLTNPNSVDQSIAFTAGQPTAFTTTTAGTDIQLEITDTGTGASLWQSGDFILSAAADRTFVLIDYFGPGTETVRLISINDPSGTALFLDEQVNSAIRFANHAANFTSLDFYIDDVLTETLAFNELSEFIVQPAEVYNVRVTSTSDPDTDLSNLEQVLFSGFFHTLQIAGNTDGTGINTNLYAEERQPVANFAEVNITKLAPAVATIDLYFQNRGEAVNGTPEGTRLADFGAGSISLPPQDYDLFITESDNANVLVGPVPITLEARNTYTIHITDSAGGGLPLEVQLLDDFQN